MSNIYITFVNPHLLYPAHKTSRSSSVFVVPEPMSLQSIDESIDGFIYTSLSYEHHYASFGANGHFSCKKSAEVAVFSEFIITFAKK